MDAEVRIWCSGGEEFVSDRSQAEPTRSQETAAEQPVVVIHEVSGSAFSIGGDALLGGALAAATLAPFLQAMSTHLGERAATAIAGVWSRVVGVRTAATATTHAVPPTEERPYEMLLEGPNGARVFLNAELPADAVRQLVEMGAEGLGPLGSDPSLRWHGQFWRANIREGAGVVGEMYWHPVGKSWGRQPPQAE